MLVSIRFNLSEVMNLSMHILFSDNDIVVCIKPVGLDSEHDVPKCLCEALGGTVFPVHRLDKQVSGVMVYARTKSAAAYLSKVIQSGEMVKEYVAWVHGITPDAGELTDLLWKDNAKNKVYVVKRKRGGVKEAKLSFETIRRGEMQSFVRVRLYTGRSHQKRVQFASRGYPLVGDHKYGDKSHWTEPKLYSCAISFPYKGQVHTFTSMPDWA